MVQHIPVGIGRRYFGKTWKNQNVKLRVGKRWWDVRVVLHISSQNYHYYMFSAGFCAFARDNSLRPGDVCEFHMVEKDPNIVFQVFISRTRTTSTYVN